MKKKNLILSISALLLTLCVASCGGDPTSSSGTTGSTGTSETTTGTSDSSEDSTTGTSVDDTVSVEKVILSVEDEEGEGTLENPYSINAAQGSNISVPFTVLPSNATNKELSWEIGRINEGVFTLDTETGVSVTATTSPALITVGEEAQGNVAIRVSTKDGSNIVNYVNIIVEAYVPVTGITVDGVMEADSEEYDYIFKTAMGTNWDMSGSQLQRGKDLLEGKVDGVTGLQAPRNLTYWPSLYGMNISINPEDASDANFTIESSNQDVFELKNDGTYLTKSAGEAIVTIKSYAQPDIQTKIKVEVAPTLYDGILQDVYDTKTTSVNTSWDLDSDHGTEAQFARYDDWNLVMMQSNARRGSTGIDSNQKIFYMGEPTRPYGINIENRVDSTTGGSSTKASGMMWAKLLVPESAKTFNVKLGSTGSAVQGEYRVLFVSEDGTKHILTGADNDGWKGFSGPNDETTVKLALDDSIKGTTGAMVVEHRVPTKDANAELSIKKLNFEGQVDPTGITLAKTEGTHKPGDTFNLGAKVTPDNVTDGSIRYYVDEASEDKGISVDDAGNVTISTDTLEGVYHVWAESVADPTHKARYTLTVALDAVVNEWSNKSEIINGVSGEKWEVVGPGDGNINFENGVGEGADIHAGESGWAALQLSNREIKESAPILTFRARTFRPTTEILPEFSVKVIEGETETVIRAIGATDDEVIINNEEEKGVTSSYDLSSYIGKTVTIQIGIDRGNHGVVTNIKFIKDAVAATSIKLSKTEGESLRGKTITFNAFVNPYDATNSFVDFSVDKADKGVSVTGVGSIATVTIAEDAELGDYQIIATARGTEVSAAYNLKVYTPDADLEVNTWEGKDQIINGNNGVAWKLNGKTDSGVGEGADLVVGSGEGWSSWELENREIKASSFMLKFGARVFHRDGETYPKFEVRITTADGTETIRGIGQSEDFFYVDTDEIQYCSYDLSRFIGQTVDVEIGITTGTHGLVTSIAFSGNTSKTSWNDKDSILNGGWTVTGEMDNGVGEGADIKGLGSSLSQSFLIGEYNDTFTFGARVFARDNETYPDIKVVVVDGETETIIRATGVDTDTVHVDTNDIQHFSYDLAAYIGKQVTIKIELANAATHCVITDINLA